MTERNQALRGRKTPLICSDDEVKAIEYAVKEGDFSQIFTSKFYMKIREQIYDANLIGNQMQQYEPLLDDYLTDYFHLPAVQKHLKKVGFIDDQNQIRYSKAFVQYHVKLEKNRREKEAEEKLLELERRRQIHVAIAKSKENPNHLAIRTKRYPPIRPGSAPAVNVDAYPPEMKTLVNLYGQRHQRVENSGPKKFSSRPTSASSDLNGPRRTKTQELRAKAAEMKLQEESLKKSTTPMKPKEKKQTFPLHEKVTKEKKLEEIRKAYQSKPARPLSASKRSERSNPGKYEFEDEYGPSESEDEREFKKRMAAVVHPTRSNEPAQKLKGKSVQVSSKPKDSKKVAVLKAVSHESSDDEHVREFKQRKTPVSLPPKINKINKTEQNQKSKNQIVKVPSKPKSPKKVTIIEAATLIQASSESSDEESIHPLENESTGKIIIINSNQNEDTPKVSSEYDQKNSGEPLMVGMALVPQYDPPPIFDAKLDKKESVDILKETSSPDDVPEKTLEKTRSSSASSVDESKPVAHPPEKTSSFRNLFGIFKKSNDKLSSSKGSSKNNSSQQIPNQLSIQTEKSKLGDSQQINSPLGEPPLTADSNDSPVSPSSQSGSKEVLTHRRTSAQLIGNENFNVAEVSQAEPSVDSQVEHLQLNGSRDHLSQMNIDSAASQPELSASRLNDTQPAIQKSNPGVDKTDVDAQDKSFSNESKFETVKEKSNRNLSDAEAHEKTGSFHDIDSARPTTAKSNRSLGNIVQQEESIDNDTARPTTAKSNRSLAALQKTESLGSIRPTTAKSNRSLGTLVTDQKAGSVSQIETEPKENAGENTFIRPTTAKSNRSLGILLADKKTDSRGSIHNTETASYEKTSKSNRNLSYMAETRKSESLSSISKHDIVARPTTAKSNRSLANIIQNEAQGSVKSLKQTQSATQIQKANSKNDMDTISPASKAGSQQRLIISNRSLGNIAAETEIKQEKLKSHTSVNEVSGSDRNLDGVAAQGSKRASVNSLNTSANNSEKINELFNREREPSFDHEPMFSNAEPVSESPLTPLSDEKKQTFGSIKHVAFEAPKAKSIEVLHEPKSPSEAEKPKGILKNSSRNASLLEIESKPEEFPLNDDSSVIVHESYAEFAHDKTSIVDQSSSPIHEQLSSESTEVVTP